MNDTPKTYKVYTTKIERTENSNSSAEVIQAEIVDAINNMKTGTCIAWLDHTVYTTIISNGKLAEGELSVANWRRARIFNSDFEIYIWQTNGLFHYRICRDVKDPSSSCESLDYIDTQPRLRTVAQALNGVVVRNYLGKDRTGKVIIEDYRFKIN